MEHKKAYNMFIVCYKRMLAFVSTLYKHSALLMRVHFNGEAQWPNCCKNSKICVQENHV